MRCGIVTFPGSNCDHDCLHVAQSVMGWDARLIWHKEKKLPPLDLVILPGGFSYGDYLRCGAIARFASILPAVQKFAAKGGLVLGICNGFQILTEAGMLPGKLMRNRSLRFICEYVNLKVEHADSPFTSRFQGGETIQIPIAHMEGNYFADPDTLKRLEDEGRVLFRYCAPDGEINAAANPNGSQRNIAGICNESKNVLGMMPHPERCSESILGGEHGRRLFESIQSWVEERV